MSAEHDGGSAFPVNATERTHGTTGMSLRDYFAAQAMHAELNTAGMKRGPAVALKRQADLSGRTVEAQIAYNAYVVADAMLDERVKK